MGLSERRRIATIKEKHQPRFQEMIREVTGSSVEFEIKAESFPEDPVILDCYDYHYENFGPGLIVEALKDICVDSMGKSAFSAKVKKIVFQNSAKVAYESKEDDMSLVLKDGVFTVTVSFYGYSDRMYSKEALIKELEAIL